MIEAMKEIGEYSLFQENKNLKESLSILVENSSEKSFEFKGIEHQGYTPTTRVTEIKKTAIYIELVANRQIYIFLNTFLYIAVYMTVNHLM